MSRTTTTNLGIGVWDDGDDAGAGTKGVTCASGGTGLNANWETLDVAVGTQHNANGTHKSNVITGSNLVQTGASSCVDGSTLEFSSNQIRVKDLGITTAKINTDAVTKEKINSDVAGSGLTQDTDGSLMVNVDNSTIKITSDKIATQIDALPFEWVLFNSSAYAGSATDNEYTELEWTQTGTSYKKKIVANFKYQTGMKYLYLKCASKTSNGSYPWYVKLSVYNPILSSTVLSATDSGTDTSYGGALGENSYTCSIAIDISTGLSDGYYYQAIVEICNGHSTVTTNIKYPFIYITTK